jgi:hypothetical protein
VNHLGHKRELAGAASDELGKTNAPDPSEIVNLESLTANVTTKAFDSFSLTDRTCSSIRLSFLFTTRLTSESEVRISLPSGVVIFDSPR